MPLSIPRIGETREECLARRRREWAAKAEQNNQKRREDWSRRKDQLNARRRELESANRDKVRAQVRESYQRNKAQRKIDAIRNHKTRKLRIVKWSETELIKKFYENCPEGYEVDHIYPLQGKTMSGLHVLKNLQYLPMHENRAKGNRI